MIIDTEVFDSFNPDRTDSYDALHDSDYTITEAPLVKSGGKPAGNDYDEQETAPKVTLTEQSLLICKSTVKGYSLKLKKWRKSKS